MTIKSISITNLLSFDQFRINDFENVNVIVGKNNVGKSNLAKLLRFFYNKLDGKKELPPELNSNYSPKGEISIEFDTSRIKQITQATSGRNSPYFTDVYNTLIKEDVTKNPPDVKPFSIAFLLNRLDTNCSSSYTLTLTIHSNGSTEWGTKDYKALQFINNLFPFFEVDTRHINLHDWDKIWGLIGKSKSLDINKVSDKDYASFIDQQMGSTKGNFNQYLQQITSVINVKEFSHQQKIISFIKAGLKGDQFVINGEDTSLQSDGTNSFSYINTLLKLLVLISNSEYIAPFIFIDEPELGLHPKKCEALIHDIFASMQNTEKVNTKIILATHSPNIVKEVVKKFSANQRIIHFSKARNSTTKMQVMNSQYGGNNFLSTFGENEARLFFSDFILFVEGETELEFFGNLKLQEHFPLLKTVDIYKSSSNTISEKLNPSYANTSIPYLFLFDADKAYDFSVGTKNILSFKKNGGLFDLRIENKYNRDSNIDTRIKKFKQGYSLEHKRIYSELIKLRCFDNKKMNTSRNRLFFNNQSEFIDFQKTLQSYLLQENVMLLSSTFEGSLICRESKSLFIDWLEQWKPEDTKLKDFTNRARRIKDRNSYLLIEYLRIIFNGKSETLIQRKGLTKTRPKIERVEKLLNFINKNYKILLDSEKTNGWVTSFLDFAINEIENKINKIPLLKSENDKKNAFNQQFKMNFPELYGILLLLRHDS